MLQVLLRLLRRSVVRVVVGKEGMVEIFLVKLRTSSSRLLWVDLPNNEARDTH